MFKCSKQQPKPMIDVLIRYRGQRSFQATTEQITKDGMFLNTHLLSIPLNTNIELQFSIGQNSYRIPAVVMDDCSRGIYVGFHNLESEAYQTFRNLQRSIDITIPISVAA
ncbi:MAG: hypothetical protein L3J79_05825 [Candidatus Marinimicrobia bacterium]|nr:hypothetical protein [Candidatus Neomarinimicrobiota bacterium]